jgi:hypothetical protein
MQPVANKLKAGMMALALSGALLAQDSTATKPNPSSLDAAQQERTGNAVGAGNTAQNSGAANASNPGFGPQAPNDATLSGGQPHSNSTYQKDRNGSQGLDLGWLGLLGLAGLLGLGRGKKTQTSDSKQYTEDMRRHPA